MNNINTYLEFLNEKTNLSKFGIPNIIIKKIHELTTLKYNSEFVEIFKKDMFKGDLSAYLCVFENAVYDFLEDNEDEEDDDFGILAIFIYKKYGSWKYINIDESGKINLSKTYTKTEIIRLLTGRKYKIYGTNAESKVKKNNFISTNDFLKIFNNRYIKLIKKLYKNIEVKKRKEFKDKILDMDVNDMTKYTERIKYILKISEDPWSNLQYLYRYNYKESSICGFLGLGKMVCNKELNDKINEIGLDKTMREFLEYLLKRIKQKLID